MLDRLGNLVTRHAIVVIAFWGAAAGLLVAFAPRWDDVTHDGDLAYLPTSMPTVQAERLLAEAFPERHTKSQLAVIVAREGAPLKADDLAHVQLVGERLNAIAAELTAEQVWTPATRGVGEKLRSRDRRAALVVLHLTNEFMATDNIRVLDRVRAEVAATDDQRPAGLQVGVTGSAAVGGDMLASAAESIRSTEAATIALVVAILLLIYRTPLMVAVPLVTIGVSIVVSMRTVAWLTQLGGLPGLEWWDFKVFTTTRIFIVVILFGAGTDFCLFLISRYREELRTRDDARSALAAAVSRVGEAVIGSAATTILGLGLMAFADFGKFRNSGPAIALCLAVTLLASLTLAPALLQLAGRAMFWPARLGAVAPGRSAVWLGFWDRVARVTIRRPGLILVVSGLLMAPLAWRGRDVPITYDLLNEMAADRPSVIGAKMLADHFAPGEMGPVTLLAVLPHGELDTAAGKRKIAELTRFLERLEIEDAGGDTLPALAKVRSLSQPLGESTKKRFTQLLRRETAAGVVASSTEQARETYLATAPSLSGSVARLDLVLPVQPFSPWALDLLTGIESELTALAAEEEGPWHGAQFYFSGTTAGTRDLKAVIESDQTRIQRLVVLGVLAVLLVVVRRPIVSLYLIATVLLSYYVTLGVTVEFFAWLYGSSFQGLDWKVPLYLFVILIAVGEDYNIYLMTRVAEEQRRHGTLPGLRRAVAQTGGIITSCGVIMAGTFISMATGNLRGVVELGFALSLGVLCDTLWVRPVLAPAFLALAARFDRRQAPTEGETSPAHEAAGAVG